MVDSSKAFEDAWKRADYLTAIRALAQLRRENKELIFNFNPPNDATLRSMSGSIPRTSIPESNMPSFRSDASDVTSPSRSPAQSSGQSGFLARAEQSRTK